MKYKQETCIEPQVPAALADRLNGLSAYAESQGALMADQLAMIYDRRWFKLFVPSSLGGLELSLPAGVRLEEELDRIDGILGRTVTLCAGANLLVGSMDRSIAGMAFAAPKVSLVGRWTVTGEAVET